MEGGELVQGLCVSENKIIYKHVLKHQSGILKENSQKNQSEVGKGLMFIF
jgi:hypothetical protein